MLYKRSPIPFLNSSHLILFDFTSIIPRSELSIPHPSHVTVQKQIFITNVESEFRVILFIGTNEKSIKLQHHMSPSVSLPTGKSPKNQTIKMHILRLNKKSHHLSEGRKIGTSYLYHISLIPSQKKTSFLKRLYLMLVLRMQQILSEVSEEIRGLIFYKSFFMNVFTHHDTITQYRIRLESSGVKR